MDWQRIQTTIELAGHLLTTEEKRRMLTNQRQCNAVTKGGLPCRNFAVWDSPHQRCERHRPDKPVRLPGARQRTRRPKCTCRAYAFPHRPTTGNCRWPEPPLIVSDKPAGTRRAKHVLAASETGRAKEVPENVTNYLGNESELNDYFYFMRGKQIRAVAALVDGWMTTQQIADKLRIHKRTLLRWKKRPDFRAYWREHRARVLGGLRGG